MGVALRDARLAKTGVSQVLRNFDAAYAGDFEVPVGGLAAALERAVLRADG